MQKAARIDVKQPSFCETVPLGERPPRLEAEGVWNPHIPVIDVVLDEDESAAGSEHRPHPVEDWPLLAVKVQRVRHHDTIERRQIEVAGEIGGAVFDLRLWEAGRHLPLILSQRGSIFIDGDDLPVAIQQIGQREGERARPCSQIGPSALKGGRAIPQQCDVIGVVHG